jgi:hypothetical protein
MAAKVRCHCPHLGSEFAGWCLVTSTAARPRGVVLTHFLKAARFFPISTALARESRDGLEASRWRSPCTKRCAL